MEKCAGNGEHRRLTMASQLEHAPRKEDTTADVIAVHFPGDNVSLDEETLHQVRGPLLALADEPSESALLLDLGNVDYLTAAVLGMLVSVHKKLRAGGRHMTVGNLSPQLYELFAVTRLDQLLDLRTGQERGPGARSEQAVLAGQSPRRWQHRSIGARRFETPSARFSG
jgi:anti-sigma B factor antagonist